MWVLMPVVVKSNIDFWLKLDHSNIGFVPSHIMSPLKCLWQIWEQISIEHCLPFLHPPLFFAISPYTSNTCRSHYNPPQQCFHSKGILMTASWAHKGYYSAIQMSNFPLHLKLLSFGERCNMPVISCVYVSRWNYHYCL